MLVSQEYFGEHMVLNYYALPVNTLLSGVNNLHNTKSVYTFAL